MRRAAISNYINGNRNLIFGLFIILVAVICSFFQKYQLDNRGVVTIAKVVRNESAVSGNDLYIKIYYNGKVYDNVANSFCSSCIGKFFFVRIVKDEPEKVVIFYNDKSVPDCILQKPLPLDGWKETPTCDDK